MMGMVPAWLEPMWTQMAALLLACMALVVFNGFFAVWWERKVSARMQLRLGPMERGRLGLGPVVLVGGVFQTLLDVVKLLGKELVEAREVDRWVYRLAPIFIFSPVFVVFLAIPAAPYLPLVNIDVALLLLFAFGGVTVLSVFMAGWSSNNKYALLGAMRAVAQNVAYEIPLLLSVLPVVLLSGSLNTTVLVELQRDGGWYVLTQPLAFVIFFVAALAETNRAPFDIPEAESELVAGFHTEYSGMRFAMFFLAEYSNMLLSMSALVALFLGGWALPGVVDLPGWAAPLVFFGKVYIMITLMMVVRFTFPRLRFDQLMSLAWKILIPLALLNLLATATAIKMLGAGS